MDDYSIKLSVIIPIYNVEHYLNRCLNSLLNTPGIEKMQIVLVDDGSIDNSGKIAESYASEHEFIECYHKANGGLSDARNYGLDKATGKYVFFCDSDDMVLSYEFGLVIKAIEQSDSDVVIWDGITIDDGDSVKDAGFDPILVHSGLDISGKIMSGREVLIRQIRDHNKVSMTVWLCAFKREFLTDNKFYFDAGLIHEDELWMPRVLLKADTVSYIHRRAYCYRIRDNSIMSSSATDQEEHAKAIVYIMNNLLSLYEEKIPERTDRDIILGYWANTYMWEIAYYDLNKYECRRQVPRLKLLCVSKGFKNKIKGVILLMFGFRVFGNLIARNRKK